MYVIDDLDTVRPLPDLPQSSVGAPIPYVLADEHAVVVAFYVQSTPPGWDGASIQVVGRDTPDLPVAIVRFRGAYAHLFGPPNDEAFSGHPLEARGLHPYGAFEIERSSWIRALAEMNSVHPYHSSALFSGYRHFILAFHDSTFECVAEGYDVHVSQGSIASTVTLMATLLASAAQPNPGVQWTRCARH